MDIPDPDRVPMSKRRQLRVQAENDKFDGDHYMWVSRTKDMSCVIRKPAFYICENKGADQLHSNCAIVFAT